MSKDNNDLILLVVIVAVFWIMTQQKKTEQPAATAANVSNAETWKWKDYKGQERSITITRDVHVS